MPGLDDFGRAFFDHVLGRAGDVLSDLTSALSSNAFGGMPTTGRSGIEMLASRLPGVGGTNLYASVGTPLAVSGLGGRSAMNLPGLGPKAALAAPEPSATVPTQPVGGDMVANTFTPSGGQYSPYDQTFARYAGAQAADPQLMAIIAAGALAESGFNPRAVGDSGHSVGLFQMHDRGAGAGLGDARYDPEVQARVMVPRYVAAYNKYRQMGYTGPQLAAWVAAEAERPLGWDNPNSAAHANYRNAYARVTAGR